MRSLVYPFVFPTAAILPHKLDSRVKVLSTGISLSWLGREYYSSDRSLIIVCHGNGHDLNSHYLDEMTILSNNLKMPVIAWDYPGYGQSKGFPTLESIENSLENILGEINHSAEKTILIGQSIGTGPVIALASKFTFQAIVLITPFRSIVKIIDSSSFLSFLGSQIDFWDSEAIFPNLKMPVLIIGAENDEVIPHSHTLCLSQCLPTAKVINFPCGHNGINWIPSVTEWITEL